jgi:hypothetical protein
LIVTTLAGTLPSYPLAAPNAKAPKTDPQEFAQKKLWAADKR